MPAPAIAFLATYVGTAVATGVVYGAIAGAVIGAAKSAMTGENILEGSLKGALIGGVVGGTVGYFSPAAGAVAEGAEETGAALDATFETGAYVAPPTPVVNAGAQVTAGLGNSGGTGAGVKTGLAMLPADSAAAQIAAIQSESLKQQATIGLIGGAATAYGTKEAAKTTAEASGENIRNMAAAEEAKKAGNKAGTAATLQPWQAVWKKTWQGDYETAVNGPLAKYRQPDKNTGLLRSPA